MQKKGKIMQEKYRHEKCPVCENRFEKDDEDIVVCPDCGTPYHRECYMQEGECVSSHLHGEYEWKSDKEKLLEHFADIEKARLMQEQLKREAYEQNVQRESARSETEVEYPGKQLGFEKVNEKDLETYLGESADYYMPRYKRMLKTGKMMSLNFSSLVFSVIYIFYKRLYGLGFGINIMLATTFALAECYFRFPPDETISSAIPTIFRVFILLLVVLSLLYPFFFFNFHYLKNATRKISALSRITDLEERGFDRETIIRHEGRSGIFACFFGIAVFMLMFYFLKSVILNFIMYFLLMGTAV